MAPLPITPVRTFLLSSSRRSTRAFSFTAHPVKILHMVACAPAVAVNAPMGAAPVQVHVVIAAKPGGILVPGKDGLCRDCVHIDPPCLSKKAGARALRPMGRYGNSVGSFCPLRNSRNPSSCRWFFRTTVFPRRSPSWPARAFSAFWCGCPRGSSV